MKEKFGLIPFEIEVLEYITKGYKNFEIAKILNTDLDKIDKATASVLMKLKVESEIKAAIKAIKAGLF